MEMHSLMLPEDQLWDPVPNNTNSNEDLLLFDDCLISKDLLNVLEEEPLSPDILNSSEELFEYDLGDTFDDQWLDQPIIIPSTEEHPALAEMSRMKSECSPPFFKRWEPINGSPEIVHLTPPQTPPQMTMEGLKNDFGTADIVHGISGTSEYLQHSMPFQTTKLDSEASSTSFLSVYQQAINLVQSPVIAQDIQREMDVVDELIRSRSQNLPDCANDDNSMESESCNSSISMASFSPGSDVSFTSNDDEWSPKSSVSDESFESKHQKSNDIVAKKKRLYRRSPEDRTHRKKEQNKNAANRYRQKKKAEIEILLDEERALAKVNEELTVKYSDIKREIKYLKSLMRELCLAKGLI